MSPDEHSEHITEDEKVKEQQRGFSGDGRDSGPVSSGNGKIIMERPKRISDSISAEGGPTGYTPLEINVTLDQIPGNHLCMLCGGLTQKTFLQFKLPYSNNGNFSIAMCERVPGYRCESCDIETYNLQAGVKVLEAVKEVVQEASDEATLRQIEASISAGKQQIASQKYSL